MNQPSEEARYLASWLKLHKEAFSAPAQVWDGPMYVHIDEERLAKEIEEYFNSRR